LIYLFFENIKKRETAIALRMGVCSYDALPENIQASITQALAHVLSMI
jgi:hypothetical protein